MNSEAIDRLAKLEALEAEQDKAQIEVQAKLREMVSLLGGEVLDGSAYALVFKHEGKVYFMREEKG